MANETEKGTAPCAASGHAWERPNVQTTPRNLGDWIVTAAIFCSKPACGAGRSKTLRVRHGGPEEPSLASVVGMVARAVAETVTDVIEQATAPEARQDLSRTSGNLSPGNLNSEHDTKVGENSVVDPGESLGVVHNSPQVGGE